MEGPVPAGVPPQLPVYHCQAVALFSDPLAMLNEVELPLQIGFALAEMVGTSASTQFETATPFDVVGWEDTYLRTRYQSMLRPPVWVARHPNATFTLEGFVGVLLTLIVPPGQT